MVRKGICGGYPNICHSVAYHYNSDSVSWVEMVGIGLEVCVRIVLDRGIKLQHLAGLAGSSKADMT